MATGTTTRDVFHHGTRARRHGEHEVDAPAFVLTRLVRAVVVGLVGAAVYLAVLMAAALVDGRSALYPLRAVYAVFNGNRYLPDFTTFPRPYGGFEIAKSLVWFATLGILAAIPPALYTPARIVRGGRLGPWLAVGIGWSLTVFVVAFVLLGFPAAPVVQRAATSFQGVRALGMPAFALAHLAYGVVIALLLRNATRTKVLVRAT